MTTCVIIDDEQQCVDTLVAMLGAKFADRIAIVGSVTDSRRAAALIAAHSPQIVFMDVEMPHVTGIQLMHAFPERKFAVVFTTAHEQYALQALKTEAVDYLMKPINLGELGEAIDKAELRLQRLETNAGQPGGTAHQKLLLPTIKGLMPVNIADIIRIEANSNYCTFRIHQKPNVVVAKTLKEYETQLAANPFFRIHQSHLINLAWVEFFHPGMEEYVILANGDQVEVSRRRKAEFLQKLAAL